MKDSMQKTKAKKSVSRVSADRRASQKSAALSKLGRSLSGRGVGSADAKAGRGAANVRKLQNAVATSRGSGRGTAAASPSARLAPTKGIRAKLGGTTDKYSKIYKY